jgi:hypothetical protein
MYKFLKKTLCTPWGDLNPGNYRFLNMDPDLFWRLELLSLCIPIFALNLVQACLPKITSKAEKTFRRIFFSTTLGKMWIHEKLNAKFAFCLSGLSVEQGCQMVYFQTKNCNLGKFRKVCKENIGIFYGHFSLFTAIWNILWTFGIFCGNLVYFPPCWYIVPRNIWQPCCRVAKCFSPNGTKVNKYLIR